MFKCIVKVVFIDDVEYNFKLELLIVKMIFGTILCINFIV